MVSLGSVVLRSRSLLESIDAREQEFVVWQQNAIRRSESLRPRTIASTLSRRPCTESCEDRVDEECEGCARCQISDIADLAPNGRRSMPTLPLTARRERRPSPQRPPINLKQGRPWSFRRVRPLWFEYLWMVLERHFRQQFVAALHANSCDLAPTFRREDWP